jgi:subtilase family serine protease
MDIHVEVNGVDGLKRITRLRVALIGVAVAALLTTTLSTWATAAAAGSSLTGSRPSWALKATDLGALPSSQRVDFQVVLAVRNAAAAEQEVAAVSTPGSSTFRQFLSDAQFDARFAPASSTEGAVAAWLRSAGLTVVSVASSRMYVEVQGTVAQADRLLGTSLHNYRYQGQTLSAPAANYVVPAQLRTAVAGIVGLDGSHATTAGTLPGPPPGARYGVQPCSAYYGQKVATAVPSAYGQQWPYTICGYSAAQYQDAFGLADSISNGNDGRGVTVAITDAYAAPTILADANTWSKRNGLPSLNGHFSQITPKANGYNEQSACGPQGWYGEETLDVEAVHGMAPGANILYAGGKNCVGGLDDAFANIIDHHLASIVTNSWTWGTGEGSEDTIPAGVLQFFHQYLLEADLTGISVLFSSGDDGDDTDTVGSRQVNFPASDPLATGVGGTSTEIGAQGHIVFQTGWSNSYSTLTSGAWSPAPPGDYNSGSGGGTSQLFRQPFYQKGRVPASISEYFGSKPMRAVPDISMPGDPNTGLLVGETQVFPSGTYFDEYRIGGTSLSSPLLAGVLADAVQYAGHAIGFINPLVYADEYTPAITDVRPQSGPEATVRTDYANFLNAHAGYLTRLQTLGVPTTIWTRRGYDDVTGVGTPNGVDFLRAFRDAG